LLNAVSGSILVSKFVVASLYLLMYSKKLFQEGKLTFSGVSLTGFIQFFIINISLVIKYDNNTIFLNMGQYLYCFNLSSPFQI